jgi:hypothetical protein
LIVLLIIAVAGATLYAFLKPPIPEPEPETVDSAPEAETEIVAAQAEQATYTDVRL